MDACLNKLDEQCYDSDVSKNIGSFYWQTLETNRQIRRPHQSDFSFGFDIS